MCVCQHNDLNIGRVCKYSLIFIALLTRMMRRYDTVGEMCFLYLVCLLLAGTFWSINPMTSLPGGRQKAIILHRCVFVPRSAQHYGLLQADNRVDEA